MSYRFCWLLASGIRMEHLIGFITRIYHNARSSECQINADHEPQIFQKPLHGKCHSNRMESIILWLDSACSHVLHRVQDQLTAMWQKMLKNLVHIWDLLPCDYHIFEPLTKALESCTFTSYNDVLQTVAKWLRQQPNKLFADGIWLLMHQWHSCVTHVVSLLTSAISHT